MAPHLWTPGIFRLDAIALMHAPLGSHWRHAHRTKKFPPERVMGGRSSAELCLGVCARNCTVAWRESRRTLGDEFDFEGARLRVLFPPRDWPVGDKPQNNDSMMLGLTCQRSSALLAEDAEKRAEHRIPALEYSRASLLKVGHHKSANATTPELIDSARPAFAVISVGSGNSFDLPRTETLAHLAAAATRVNRTDLNGAVTFYLDGRSVKPVSTGLQGSRSRRFRHRPSSAPADDTLRSAFVRPRHPARARG